MCICMYMYISICLFIYLFIVVCLFITVIYANLYSFVCVLVLIPLKQKINKANKHFEGWL